MFLTKKVLCLSQKENYKIPKNVQVIGPQYEPKPKKLVINTRKEILQQMQENKTMIREYFVHLYGNK